ncbi:MAG: putative secreted hydrolase [uncultured Nocardioidaceae bacterium]|uniref:Putative secreted hydrolase n=1 Tax=uncultured Nocardioidaceae bacterium TaxID=253824 RepID=A0A6J4M658_9ACTN|nr:MAG: putative secreted hydrolase [uncultured Nocardioidaceae bacterium]
MFRRTAVPLLGAAVAAALLGAPSQAAPSEASEATDTRPLRYVAMGDSYSAASGVLPPDPTAPAQCLRSIRNYPHVIAARTEVRLVDVTCGGAETKNYFRSQYDGVPPQLDALTRRTRLVTMTIGGNNNDTFIGAIIKCGAAGLVAGGKGSPCEEQYGSSFADDIRTKTFPALLRALRAVHRRAPRARVAILGYPWILPERVGCFDRLPVARGDVPYVHGIQALLNRKVRRAASRTGSSYVDLSKVSVGHDACRPIGERWIEPIIGTTNPIVVHPNALGERKMARRTMRVMKLG